MVKSEADMRTAINLHEDVIDIPLALSNRELGFLGCASRPFISRSHVHTCTYNPPIAAPMSLRS